MKLNNQQIREQIEEAKSLPMFFLEAIDYLRLCYRKQLLLEAQLPERLDEITLDCQKSRTYWYKDELIYGAKVA